MLIVLCLLGKSMHSLFVPHLLIPFANNPYVFVCVCFVFWSAWPNSFCQGYAKYPTTIISAVSSHSSAQLFYLVERGSQLLCFIELDPIFHQTMFLFIACSFGLEFHFVWQQIFLSNPLLYLVSSFYIYFPPITVFFPKRSLYDKPSESLFFFMVHSHKKDTLPCYKFQYNAFRCCFFLNLVWH